MLRKILFGGGLVIIAIIAGFIFLLRSCLSQYDERSMLSHPLFFEKDGRMVVFSLVKFDKTTSYSRNGGFVRKSVSTSYSIQANNAVNGEKINAEKIKDHSDIKSYPVEVMGAAEGRAWVFAGEPMAFDPFTLSKFADIKILESKNPSLTDKFSRERKYYELDMLNKVLIATLKDGSKYQFNLNTLMAVAIEGNEIIADPVKAREKQLQDALKKLRDESDSNFRRYREANKKYSGKLIDMNAYKNLSAVFETERKRLDAIRDSIYRVQSQSNSENNQLRTIQNRLRTMESHSLSYGSSKVNSDTFYSQWYGLYSAEELNDLSDLFDYRASYNDVARNGLYKASIYPTDKSRFSSWKVADNKRRTGNSFYLQGGFLLDRETAQPYHLGDPAGYLVVHKTEVGHAANILISRIDTSGKQLWTVNTQVKEFSYWMIKGSQLIITGLNNKELSSGESNMLHVINMATGRYSSYDFFTDKMIKPSAK